MLRLDLNWLSIMGFVYAIAITIGSNIILREARRIRNRAADGLVKVEKALALLEAEKARWQNTLSTAEAAEKAGAVSESKTTAILLQWKPNVENDLCLLGYPIRIRRTAIGKPFRLVEDGQDDVAYDDSAAAIHDGNMRAMRLELQSRYGTDVEGVRLQWPTDGTGDA